MTKTPDNEHLPQHVAIIMDGNGRWAKQRGLPRSEGHKQGAKVFKRICEYAADIGIRYVTFYAFSTENWRRPPEEVSGIMNLFRDYLREAEERERIEGAARAEQHRKDLLDCWGAHIDEETLQEGRRDHTAYQWCDLGFVPIAEARWRLTRYGGNSAWYYCSPWDVRYDPDRAKELLETGPREYDRLPDGRPYDGRPWWQA